MTDHSVEQEIINLAHEWIEAAGQHDRTSLERILAEDFEIAGWLPEGQLGNRQTYIEDCLRPVALEQPSYRYDRWRIRVFGDLAVVNCTLEIHALVAGSNWGGLFLHTHVWVKRAGRWQVVACH